MGVGPGGGKQGRMSAPFDDPSVIEHEYLIGMADRAQAMGDDEARPARQKHAQRSLNASFRDRIDAARRLVENQNPRIGEHRPGEADRLPLSQRKAIASLA